MTAYAELQVTSNFSFLRGGSFPQDYVDRACLLGHQAVAITDINTLAGVVQAYDRVRTMRRLAQEIDRPLDFKFVLGSRIVLEDGGAFLLYPTDRFSYGKLCRLLTLGKRRAHKGECHLTFDDLLAHAEGQMIIAVPPETLNAQFRTRLETLAQNYKRNVFLAAAYRYRGDDEARLKALHDCGRDTGAPIVATNDVLYHAPERRRLQDVLTCIREKCTIDEAGLRLEMNAERHLKPADEMARLFRRYPEALERTIEIAERCRFDMGALRYEYPEEIVTPGLTPQQDLEQRTWAGAKRAYPKGTPQNVIDQINKELHFIAQKEYAPFFLTIDEIVKYARSIGVLCQGRGSAANSAVCYVLGVTAVDPSEGNCLFERFISEARNEPPDIDVDFEHERREEVIQHIYNKYGRDRAGIAATVIHYRWRRAIREVGKALTLSEDVTAALSRAVWGWDDHGVSEKIVRGLGLDPDAPRLRLALDLAHQLLGFPRHLSQHVGGFVIARGLLSELVPIENAAMEDRTIIEWDKDDIERLGILKVDVLGLGMLTCIRKAFDLLKAHYGIEHNLSSVPSEDPAVYDMLCQADSVGVFQVESRAQMSMLPRLKPRTFYDLVIEVAIVRPGPIQGDMVHPYLRRRNKEEEISYPSKELEDVLGKTMGVPLFQEQAMKIAIVAAGFTPAEADELRRAMATFRNNGNIENFRDRFITGMTANGYARDFTERCFKQIEGFGTYGFPESHAASFAKLVYISSWLKCHHPEVFACALLNSQPMGFYAPAQIVRDAREHGVELLPIDVTHSTWDNHLESRDGARCALRLGFREIKGLPEEDTRKIELSRIAHLSPLPNQNRQSYDASSESFDALPRLPPPLTPPRKGEGNVVHLERSAVGKGTKPTRAPAAILTFPALSLDQNSPPPCGEGLGVGVSALARQEDSPPNSEVVNNGQMDGRDKLGHDDSGFDEEWSAAASQDHGDCSFTEESPDQISLEEEATSPIDASLYGFWRRTGIRKASLIKLAEADAFGSLGLSRRQALWEAQRVKDVPLPLFAALEREDKEAQPETAEEHVTLPMMPASTEVVEDYRSIGLSLKNHPFAFLRDDLTAMRCRPSRDIPGIKHGSRTRVAGMVLVRQRPGSASGVIFITLEDEFGIVNIIVWPSLFDRYRREILTSKFLAVEGKLQREGLVVHIVAEKLSNITHLAEKLDPESREITLSLAHADEVVRPGGDRRDIIARRRQELAATAERLKIKSRDFH